MSTGTQAQPAIGPRRAPGPSLFSMPRRLRRFRSDPLSLLRDDFTRFGDVVRFRIGPTLAFTAYHPDHARHVLQMNHLNYRRSVFYEMLKPLLGEGLLTSDGAHWRRQRRLMQPAFHRERLARLTDGMTSEVSRMLDDWAVHARSGVAVDVSAEMMRLTLAIAGRALFGAAEVRELSAKVGAALTVAMHEADRRMNSILRWPLWLPTPSHLRGRAAKRELDGVVRGILDRHDDSSDAGDEGQLLAMLLDARDEETGERMSREHLHDEVMTLLLAGHETSANLMGWTFYLLARHPEVEARVYEESQRVLGGSVPRTADLERLRYTRQVLEEVLRLYPPAWAMDREAIGEDALGPFHIPPGAVVIVTPYMTHRHPEFWPDPERFDPERFDPERRAARHRYAYFPFGGGPRQCIGNHFAMIEAQLATAMMVSRYKLERLDDAPLRPEPSVTLRVPRLMMRLRPRS